jgi:hypothetical protein
MKIATRKGWTQDSATPPTRARSDRAQCCGGRKALSDTRGSGSQIISEATRTMVGNTAQLSKSPMIGRKTQHPRRSSISLAGLIPETVSSTGGLHAKDAIENALGADGWRIEELQSVASDNHLEWHRPGRGGSHVIFSAPGVREIVSVPSKRPIKPISIKQFLALVDAAIEVKQNESQKEADS